MADIEIIAKWDSKHHRWNKNPEKEDYGRSFAFVNYHSESNKKNIHYIFFSPGERVEDHSKDQKTISIKENRMDRIIDHYKKKKENYSIKMFLMDADAPIREDAKLFAKVIEDLCNKKETNSVTLVGFSKCSVMNFYIPKHFKKKKTYQKINMINVAGPYEGTIMASPKFLWKEASKYFENRFHNKKLAEKAIKKLKEIYQNVSSNSHMDYDIALPDGVEEEQRHLYDKKLIKNVFKKDNVRSIRKLRVFQNVVTGIDQYTLKENVKTRNKNGILLCISNKLFLNNESDGLVKISSQEKVDKVVGIKSKYLKSSHHDITSSKRLTEELLQIIDETVEKGYQKKL